MPMAITMPSDELGEFCRRHDVRRLLVFGSVLRPDFRDDSDVDMLIEMNPRAKLGLFKLTRLQMELSELIGREVDLNTPGFISPRYRDEVMAAAEVLYADG